MLERRRFKLGAYDEGVSQNDSTYHLPTSLIAPPGGEQKHTKILKKYELDQIAFISLLLHADLDAAAT